MQESREESELLRSAALQNAQTILQARLRAERELEKRTEELAHLLATLRATLESTSDAILVTDGDGRVTDFNQKYLKMWRIPSELMETRAHRKLLQVCATFFNQPAPFLARIEEIYRSSLPETYDLLELNDGRVFERFTRLQSVAGRNAGRVWSFRDITAHKNAADELRHQREWFKVTLASIGDAVITTDTQSRITFLNPTAEVMTGWKGEEAQGKPLADVVNIVNEKSRKVVESPVARALQSGSIVELENHAALIARDGTEVAIEDSAAPIRDPKGKIAGAVMVFHDVTEKRRAQEELKESQSRLNMAMTAGQMGAWEWIISTGQVTWSPTLESIHGLKPGTFGGHLEDFKRDIHPGDRDRVFKAIEETLLSHNEYMIEYRIIRPDGSIAWLETRGKLIVDARGNPERMSGICADITARRNAGEALRRSEQFNRSIIESSRDCIKTLSLTGDLLWISEAGQKLLCLTDTAQVIGSSWVAYWSEADRPAAQAAVNAAANGGAGYFIGSLAVQGQLRWWDVMITPILEENGKPEKLLAVSRDITERRHAEEASLRLAAVVESSEDAIVSKTLDGIIRTWNPAAERMFGYSANEVIGKHISIIFPRERLSEEDKIISRLRQGLRVEHYETVRLRKDGTPIDVSLSVSAIKDSSGRIIGASKIARDITHQKKAALALKEEARHLEILNDTGKAIASQLELQNLVQTVTDAGTLLSGAQFGAFFYNVTSEKGESFQLFSVSGTPREEFEKLGMLRNVPEFNETFRTLSVVRSADITKDTRHGSIEPHHGLTCGRIPVRSYLAVPVISRTKDVIGGLFFGHSQAGVFTERVERLMVGIAAQAAIAIDNARLYEAGKREIEQRALAEKKLQAAKDEAERANRAKDEFLAIVSHELRTPLTSILGWTRMLMSGTLDQTKAEHGIRVIERNVKLQTQLIEDLLDVSRVITGKLMLTLSTVDLVKVISAAIDSIKPAADAKQILLEPVNESSVNTIIGDSGRLQQIFWNLLSNAVKFTPKGGRVEIRITRVDAVVRVTISDTGRGIDPAFLPLLFERFRQLDSTTTRVHGGLGLGLAIVRYLVEQHGGHVTAASDGVGKGSTFTVELPIRATATLSPAAPDSSNISLKPGKPLAGQRVLVLEDETDSRDLILTVLETAGACGVGVSSVDEALHEIGCRKPDVIVSDIGMPQKDGYEFVRQLRKEFKSASRIPVIAVTAYAREEDRVTAMEAGFDMYVPKPIDPAELIRRVTQAINT
ncbi:MAG TPA: PAS domain S-box protein [Planctomycetota bacterium]|nr:PAS domain S-box protein [Planctomycetota bacterium]